MSEKKKKSKKSESNETLEDGLKPSDKQIVDEVTLQVYEAKIHDLSDRLNRSMAKCKVLMMENQRLGELQANFLQDREDVVEFLNVNVKEQEKEIFKLKEQCQEMEQLKTQAEQAATNAKDEAKDFYQREIDQLTQLNSKYKNELDQLAEFRDKKTEMEAQLRSFKSLLDAKEKEFKEVIHNMERKVLQDKNLMKKEMLQKVNEAVTNFRKVADLQMAETTKRAIRENMIITTQLKKMSSKTMELISENDALKLKVSSLKSSNSILAQAEKELARRNNANQKVIRMLIDKLKESDKMLEFVSYANEQVETDILEQSYSREMQMMKDEYDQILLHLQQQHNNSLEQAEATAEKLEFYEQLLHEIVRELQEVLLTFKVKRETLDNAESLAELNATLKLTAIVKRLEMPFENVIIQPSPEPVEVKEELQPQRQPQRPKTANNLPTLKNVAIQTRSLPFDADRVKASHLLSELRPWGPPSMSLPKKGPLYKHQKFQMFGTKHQFYVPKPPQLSDSLVKLLEPTPSTLVLRSKASSTSSF